MDKIPLKTLNTLRLYIAHGLAPGHFLTAVLCNDLRNAVARADGENADALVEIVRWINNNAPTACWGSPQAVQRWQISKRRTVKV